MLPITLFLQVLWVALFPANNVFVWYTEIAIHTNRYALPVVYDFMLSKLTISVFHEKGDSTPPSLLIPIDTNRWVPYMKTCARISAADFTLLRDVGGAHIVSATFAKNYQWFALLLLEVCVYIIKLTLTCSSAGDRMHNTSHFML